MTKEEINTLASAAKIMSKDDKDIEIVGIHWLNCVQLVKGLNVMADIVGRKVRRKKKKVRGSPFTEYYFRYNGTEFIQLEEKNDRD